MDLIGAVKGLASKRSQHNDDLFVDRLNHRYTVGIIVFFAVVVTASQYSGKPINCWVPGHFTGNYNAYADDICWVSSTYNIPIDEDLPHDEKSRKDVMLKYYQWTPFILLLSAMCFYFPRMIWRSLNDKSGLDLQTITDAVYNQAADREGLLSYLANSFDHYVNSNKKPNELEDLLFNQLDNTTIQRDTIHFRKRKNVYAEAPLKPEEEVDEEEMAQYIKETEPKSGMAAFKENFCNAFKNCCITKGKRNGNYLTVLFVATRIMYTVNSISQLFVLNHFLGNDFIFLGFEIMHKVWYGLDWAQLQRFPRVTMCDFKIREVGITHRYTVQCVLSINLFNEKIFIFLWFWFCLVSFMNIFDLIGWVHSIIVNKTARYHYIQQRLYASNNNNKNGRINLADPEDKKYFKKFVNNYLKEDGVLALRFLSRNSQDLIVAEVLQKLFESYKENQIHLKEQKRQKRHRQSHHQIADNEYDETARFATVNETPSATTFLNRNLESSH